MVVWMQPCCLATRQLVLQSRPLQVNPPGKARPWGLRQHRQRCRLCCCLLLLWGPHHLAVCAELRLPGLPCRRVVGPKWLLG